GPGAYPVDNLSWLQAAEALRRLGGVLPTEAQWEAAARAGTRTPWFFADDVEGAARTSNVSDQSFLPFAPPGWDSGSWDDGFGLPAPVGSFEANPFGLHDVHGNVWEWARDPYFKFSESTPRDGDGLRSSELKATRVTLRSGAWNSTIHDSRAAYRLSASADSYFYGTGLRPARTLRAFRRAGAR
ncbi:MAG: formylglycine-generating enzyme family protein, partial [Planctomycetota bacterium]